MAITRRILQFAALPDAVREAELLRDRGYDRAGQWSLAQCCGHLANWLSYPLDGFPPLPFALKPVFWVMRKTMANGMLDKVLKDEAMPAGSSTAPQSIPPPGGDDREAVEAYRKAVDRWLAWDGPLKSSPVFGDQSKERLEHLHRVHAAHHLGFLVPKS